MGTILSNELAYYLGYAQGIADKSAGMDKATILRAAASDIGVLDAGDREDVFNRGWDAGWTFAEQQAAKGIPATAVRIV